MIQNFIDIFGEYSPIITEYTNDVGETLTHFSINWGYIGGIVILIVMLCGLQKFIRGVLKHYE